MVFITCAKLLAGSLIAHYFESASAFSTKQACNETEAEILNDNGEIIHCMPEDPAFTKFRTENGNGMFVQSLPDFSYSGFCTGEDGYAQQSPPSVLANATILQVLPTECGQGEDCGPAINRLLDEAASLVDEESIRLDPEGPHPYVVVQLPAGVVELHSDNYLDPYSKSEIKASIRIRSSYTILRGDPASGTNKFVVNNILLTGDDDIRGGTDNKEFDNFFYIQVQTKGPIHDGVGVDWKTSWPVLQTGTLKKGQRCVNHNSYCGNTGKFVAGDYVMLRFYVKSGDAEYEPAKAELYPGANFPSEWTNVNKEIRIQELHRIENVTANEVCFKEPLNTDIPYHPKDRKMYRWMPYTNIGIENLVITSDWETRHADFVHHEKGAIGDVELMDYGWQAIYLQDTKYSWVSNVEFNGISVGMKLDYTKNNLVNNAKFTGAAGHTGITSRRGTGNLFRDNLDSTVSRHGCTAAEPSSQGDCNTYGGMFHTFGVAYYDSASVFLRSITPKASHIDAHGGEPRATLFDSHVGGHLSQFGGGDSAMPHHAGDLTIWNMKYSGDVPYSTTRWSNYTYEFWSQPNLIAFETSKYHFVHNPSIHGVCTTDRGLGFNPLDFGSVRYSGCAAEALDYGVDYQGTHPESLYEAQSALRDLHSIPQDLVRSIVRPALPGGRNPRGANSQAKPCGVYLPPEQVAGTWGSWSAWTTCNGECGTGQVGTQERVRTCEANKECVLSQGSGSQGVTTYTRRQTDSKACTTQPCGVCDCGAWVPTGGCTDGVLEYTRDECGVGQPQVLTVLHLDGSDSGTCVAPKGQTLSVGKCSPFTVKMNVELSGSRVRFGHRNWCVDLGDDASFLGTPVKIYNCAETDPDLSLGLKIASVQFATDPETSVTLDIPYSLWGYRMSSTEPLCMGVVADSRGDQYVATVLCFAPEASVADLEVPEGHAVVSRTLMPRNETLKQNLQAKCNKYPTTKTVVC